MSLLIFKVVQLSTKKKPVKGAISFFLGVWTVQSSTATMKLNCTTLEQQVETSTFSGYSDISRVQCDSSHCDLMKPTMTFNTSQFQNDSLFLFNMTLLLYDFITSPI